MKKRETTTDNNFLSQNAAAKYLGVSVVTLMRYRKKGYFEEAVQLLPHLILYPVHALEDFAAADLKRPYVKHYANKNPAIS